MKKVLSEKVYQQPNSAVWLHELTCDDGITGAITRRKGHGSEYEALMAMQESRKERGESLTHQEIERLQESKPLQRTRRMDGFRLDPAPAFTDAALAEQELARQAQLLSTYKLGHSK